MEQRRSEVLSASPRMFDSRLLDALSRVHPAVPPIIFAPAIAIFSALALDEMGAVASALWILGGYVVWTLTEYWIHRAIFHFEPEQGFGARFHWIVHGVHHDHPNDPMRLVMPPAVSVPLSTLFFGLFVAAVGTPSAYGLATGFFAGYLAYDMLHYHLHHRTPTTRLGKLMRELHMRHHFQDDTGGFGISAPYWDGAFGTSLRRGKKG